jgi:hypothetical protein
MINYFKQRIWVVFAIISICHFSENAVAAPPAPFPSPSAAPGSQTLPVIGTDPDFGFVPIGQSVGSGTYIFSIGGDIDYFSVQLVGPSDFQLTLNTCNGGIAENSACFVGVSFTPTVSGEEAAAVVFNSSSGTFSYA